MGSLKHDTSGSRISLGLRSLVGRAEGCVVRLMSRRASGEHAVIIWDGEHWYLRDLGSTNGTLVDGRKAAVGERVRLSAGTVLVFGVDAEQWVLDDPGPPIPCARCEDTGEVRRAEDGLLVLPDASDPRLTVFEDRLGRWVVEAEGEVRPAVDGERLEAGSAWVLSVPPTTDKDQIPTTHPLVGTPRIMGTTVLRFEVSRDGEHIALSLVTDGVVTPLGGRAYHELLLALARARLRDKEASLPPSEQGWLYVDDLLGMLKIDLQHLNVNVFRARQHLARAGVLDVGSLVERRSTTRQIRLGTDALEIVAS